MKVWLESIKLIHEKDLIYGYTLDSVLDYVQKVANAGCDFKLTQIKDGVGAINILSLVQCKQPPICAFQRIARDLGEPPCRGIALSHACSVCLQSSTVVSLVSEA